ncbi:MAG: hypothetical protein HRU26_00075, partial [Psychroserpens sp.]|nr:hypothetical protein [Psychroserpens sp.]
MKNIRMTALFCLLVTICQSQTKNFIDQPYLETQVEIDTLVTPDKIHMTIILNEADNRNKKSTETLEKIMISELERLNIDVEKNLSLLDFSSDFKKYFLSSKKVLKSKMYSLIVHDARTAGKV